MNIIEVRSDKTYEKMMNSSKGKNGYGVVMASSMLGFLPSESKGKFKENFR